jgi:hypothetical protein
MDDLSEPRITLPSLTFQIAIVPPYSAVQRIIRALELEPTVSDEADRGYEQACRDRRMNIRDSGNSQSGSKSHQAKSENEVAGPIVALERFGLCDAVRGRLHNLSQVHSAEYSNLADHRPISTTQNPDVAESAVQANGIPVVALLLPAQHDRLGHLNKSAQKEKKQQA